MPGSDELEVAQIIADCSLWGIGRALGVPILNDDGSEPAMFDIRFDDTEPPVAMEIWSVVDGTHRASAVAAGPVADRLTALAIEAADGHWYFNVVAGTDLRSLEDWMAEIVRGDLQPPQRDETPEGVLSVGYESGTDQATIVTWDGVGAHPLMDLGADLAAAIHDNEQKLADATGFEGHLAVDVQALRASDPARTPVPHLPESITYLWVTRRWVSSSRPTPVVWVTDGRGWRVNGEPHEAM